MRGLRASISGNKLGWEGWVGEWQRCPCELEQQAVSTSWPQETGSVFSVDEDWEQSR